MEEEFARDRASLVVIYGRRRIGKTMMLRMGQIKMFDLNKYPKVAEMLGNGLCQAH